ncbi:C3a anaphylatoxin chemotactic receptor [Sarcophilus harrisii]|uniref:C3a anaphylatoxin chemotactic receptor n=1 Tax=Sarcophilus harrisii TaxID=9305 RepID=A0A7N4NGB6_SARHA|nr:C3a anaphylatoxin chemotactic receptor [Sarcophilus harrisii]
MPLTNSSSSDLIPQPLREPQVMISIAIFSFTFLLGLPGNGLVFWVIGFKMKRTVNTIWFLHLTVADLFCCLSVPFSLIHLVLQGHWPYGWLLCKLIPSIIILNMFASVFLLTAISLDRCVLVLQPVWCQNHRTVKMAFSFCAGIWVLAFAMCTPVFLYRETFTENNCTVCAYNFEENNPPDYIYFSPSLVEEGSLKNSSVSELAGKMEGTLYPSSSRRDDSPWLSTTPDTPGTSGVFFHTKVGRGHSGDTLGTVSSVNLNNHHSFPDLSELPKKLHDKSPTISPVLPEFTNNDSSTDTPRNSDVLAYDSAGALPWTSNNPLDIPEVTEDFLDFIYEYDFNENQLSTTLVAITVTRLVIGFLLPFAIMMVCYTLIIFRLNRSHFAKSRSKTLKVAVVVVITFFVCWTPYHIIGVLSLIASPYSPLGKAVIALDNLSIALASANSCLNPLLYAFMGKDFRQKAQQSIQGILEAAFSEDPMHSSSCPQNKTSLTQDVVSTAV